MAVFFFWVFLLGCDIASFFFWSKYSFVVKLFLFDFCFRNILYALAVVLYL